MPYKTNSAPDATPPEWTAYGWDAFEQGLLCVSRHFLQALHDPDAHSWHRAYTEAAERWTDTLGLRAAHHLQKLVRAVFRARGGQFACHAPFSPEANGAPTSDERLLIDLLHHMRRDQIPAARRCVEDLTHQRMDPDVIRAGFGFARQFSAGQIAPARLHPPALRVIA